MNNVYLIRHSKPQKLNNVKNSDCLQEQNEKQILSVEGEEFASKKFSSEEFKNIDILFSSNYVRAIGTAKYIAQKNNIDININEDFGERKFGINSWSELPENFELKQFEDENYKIGDGESQKEVSERMYNALMLILNQYENNNIAIVTHSTAMLYLLKKLVDIDMDGNCYFNQKIFFNCKGNSEYCQTFKITFENNKLIDIKII